MKIAIYSLNMSFMRDIVEKLSEKHKIKVYQPTKDSARNLLTLGSVGEWAEVHFVEFCQDPLPIVMQFKCAKPLVVRLHRLEVYSPLVQQLKWNQVDLMIFSSEHVKNKFFGRAITRPKNSIVIPTNGVDLKKFAYEERDYDRDEVRLCMVGTLLPKKRVYTTIQMLADLPENFKLTVIGGINPALRGYGNSEYKENLNDLVKTLGLKDRVKFLGQVNKNQIPKLLVEQDIIISNSNEEGTAVALAEAMATGCVPIINCWLGAEKLYPEDAIFKTFSEFKKKVLKWSKLTIDQKKKAAKRAHNWISSKYNIDVLTKKLITEIEKLV